MIASVERILREKVMENAHTVGTANQALQALQDKLSSYDAVVLATVPAVRMAASHWQEAAQRLKETIGEMCIKEKWLEERMRKECEERENEDKARGEEVGRKFESAIEREKVASRSYQDTFAELERSKLEQQKRSVEMDEEIAGMKDALNKADTTARDLKGELERERQRADTCLENDERKIRKLKKEVEGERERADTCIASATRLEKVLQRLKADLLAQDKIFALQGAWRNWQQQKIVEGKNVDLKEVRMEVLAREHECKEAAVALERARSQHSQDLQVSLRQLHSERHAREMQRQESERAAALLLDTQAQLRHLQLGITCTDTYTDTCIDLSLPPSLSLLSVCVLT
jgi:hypothetical protein